MLADMPANPSLCRDEQRNAVRRRLHDRSRDQAVLRLRPNAAGSRALAHHGECGTSRTDGAVAGAYGRRRFAADCGIVEALLTRLRAAGGAR